MQGPHYARKRLSRENDTTSIIIEANRKKLKTAHHAQDARNVLLPAPDTRHHPLFFVAFEEHPLKSFPIEAEEVVGFF